MANEHEGVSPASAGGASASKLCFAPVGQNGRGLAIRCDLPWGHPGAHHGVAGIDYGLTARAAIPEPFRRMFWVAAEDIANVIGCTVVEGEPRGYDETDPRDAEIERLRVQFDGIRGALRAANILIEGTRSERDQARAEVEELETQRDDQAVGIEHWQGLAETRGAQVEEFARTIRELTNERDRLRAELDGQRADKEQAEAAHDRLRTRLDQHLADENSAQAANDRLRDEIQNLNAGHDGTMRYITNRLSDILDADTTDIHELLNVASLRVESGDEASAELKRRELQPPFRPGQRVRIGGSAGTVVTPRDITRVRLDGVPNAHEFETRFVRPTPYDEEVPF